MVSRSAQVEVQCDRFDYMCISLFAQNIRIYELNYTNHVKLLSLGK